MNLDIALRQIALMEERKEYIERTVPTRAFMLFAKADLTTEEAELYKQHESAIKAYVHMDDDIAKAYMKVQLCNQREFIKSLEETIALADVYLVSLLNRFGRKSIRTTVRKKLQQRRAWKRELKEARDECKDLGIECGEYE